MKKLLVITGAGASLDFGMPSAGTIDKLFDKWGLEILPLKSNKKESLYTWVKQSLFNYVKQNPSNRINYLVNFESLLYTIQNLFSLSQDQEYSRYCHRLNPFIQIKDFPELIINQKEKKAESYDFHNLHSHLVDSLLDYFREKCKTLTADKENELSLLQAFFKTLKTKFELGFVNLNYDNVILTTVPNLNTGFDKDTGKFNRNLLYNAGWNFCYHLHGSIYFDMIGGDEHTEMHKICWNNNLASKFSNNSSGRNGINTIEGIDHLTSSIITGLDKSNQILREPFASYYMQLDRLIHEADSILFLGYGFHDNHLNNIFPFIRYDKNNIRKVVVVDFATDDEDGLSFRHDDWSYGVLTTLPFNGFEMGKDKSSSAEPVIHYRKTLSLEKSKNANLPLAVWYNGLLEACKNSEKILNELI